VSRFLFPGSADKVFRKKRAPPIGAQQGRDARATAGCRRWPARSLAARPRFCSKTSAASYLCSRPLRGRSSADSGRRLVAKLCDRYGGHDVGRSVLENFISLREINGAGDGLYFREFIANDLKLGRDLQRSLRGRGKVATAPYLLVSCRRGRLLVTQRQSHQARQKCAPMAIFVLVWDAHMKPSNSAKVDENSPGTNFLPGPPRTMALSHRGANSHRSGRPQREVLTCDIQIAVFDTLRGASRGASRTMR
jgi:hypothetical protein